MPLPESGLAAKVSALPNGFEIVPPLTSAAPPAPIKTPCVKVCVIDGLSSLCLGCYRTLPEIARWSKMSEAERDVVMADLPRRAANPPPDRRGMV